ncbi:carbamoyl phosphate synthase, partial [Parabacteroides distasonis]
MNNILFCSVGRRATLLKDFRLSMNGCGRIIATDLSPV